MSDEKLGEMYLTSKGYEDKCAGKMRVEYAKYLGKLENGVISFPAEAIGVKLPQYYKDNIWWTNTSACFGVRLPHAGVDEVECVREGEDVYYTLQGVRTASPVKGNIYVRVRDGKAVRIVY